ncbi:hypothetical protein GGU10DRAFT_399721 [Lentinula aff. detonsa]|uniref:Uncharacterized protein n=1 Tax=Lentinula aff. detonsa TaxID=2804958 RepID=A0AA38KP97_9AGAR|nr:hypothetical protein GGU10DRAFT_399721 [Lentinula aff. detonsa]
MTWELSAPSTLFCVSRDFQDITANICQKLYGLPDKGRSLVQSANTRLAFLQQSGRRDIYSLKPIIFDEGTFKTPFLQSYILLLTIVQMRKIMKVPSTPALFRHMHISIYRSFATLQVITMSFGPRECYRNLVASGHMQRELLNISLEIVNELDDLQQELSDLQGFNPEDDIHRNGANEVIDRIGVALRSVQGNTETFEEIAAIASRLTGPEVKVHELPGVMNTMKRIRTIMHRFKNVVLDAVILKILNEITDGWPMQESAPDV